MGDLSKKNFIIIRETVVESWLRDASTFAVFGALIGLGVYLESAAMQWAGLIVAFTVCLSRANGKRKDMTAEEAIKFIQSLEV